MDDYFQKLNKIPQTSATKEIKEYALKNNVPIISDEGLFYLLYLIKHNKVKKILEIGTAIAYSSIHFALQDRCICVDTIERAEEMVKIANQNIKDMKLSEQIKVYQADALLIDVNLLHKDYDLIFIDGAKAQYQKFFARFSGLLKIGGLIVSDNLLFHGLVSGEERIEAKSLRLLVAKIRSYNEWLASNSQYRTIFLNLGDGLAVSEKL